MNSTQIQSSRNHLTTGLAIGVAAFIITFSLALTLNRPSQWALAAAFLLVNISLLAARGNPDGRIYKIIRLDTEREMKFMLLAIPCGILLATLFFIKGHKVPAELMWGAMLIALIRYAVSPKDYSPSSKNR